MQWRLLEDQSATGAWNMAVDEAMLLAHTDASTRIDAGTVPFADTVPVAGTLRFYGWNPPCLSLGRFQKWEQMIGGAPAFDVVRRPTGGRAVWHQHEITYCAIFSEEILPRGCTSVAGAYAWLSRGFIAGLEKLGVQATLAPGGNDRAQTVNCFASATRADFVVDGRKLLGAAQCRQNGVVLQHGSLLLDVDEDAWRRSVGNAHDVITLKTLGVRTTRREILSALATGCGAALGISLVPGKLSAAEAALATRLQAEKYTQVDWNRDRRTCSRRTGG